MAAEPDVQVIESRSYSLWCDVAKSNLGFHWRFRNAFMRWSEPAESIDAAFSAAMLFAEQHMVPITPSPTRK